MSHLLLRHRKYIKYIISQLNCVVAIKILKEQTPKHESLLVMEGIAKPLHTLIQTLAFSGASLGHIYL